MIDENRYSRIIHKYGKNSDIDLASTPEDVWEGGGLYSFPASAGTVVVYSDSAADNATGTGAHGLVIEGLDADYKEISETIELNGTTTVTATSTFLRTFRAYVTSVGASGANEGLVTVEIDGTESARISSAQGQTLMCLYTIPQLHPQDNAYLLGWGARLPTTLGANAVDLRLVMRERDGAWRTQDNMNLDGTTRHDYVLYPEPLKIGGEQDWRVVVDAVSANSTVVAATMDLKYTIRYYDIR